VGGRKVRLERTVSVDIPVRRAFDYLADFTATTEWDPGTVSTVRCTGDGGVGTTYRNTTKFLGRETSLIYVVEDLVTDELVRLRGENTTVISVDTMSFRQSGSRTEVTYTAEFTFKGASRLLAPLLKPAFTRLGDHAEAGLRSALLRLTGGR
jgi:Polyketide cyclase / dehydrase and lipid transport